jgi:hypothetical protein
VIRLTRCLALALALFAAFAAPDADAKVRLTFWSRDSGSYFPHAFVTLKGTLDETGEPVDTSYGFTLNSATPIALFASVPAHIDITSKRYMRESDAQFFVEISDTQYQAIVAQATEWGAKGSRWSLNKRNCVHFAAEAARRAGLTVVEDKKLMKKPKSFTVSLIPLNPGRVTVLGMKGAAYWAQQPEQENFGVPEKNGGSVLEREIGGIPAEDKR